MLKIENLNKTFNKKKILDDINVNIHPGEIAIFLGASGVGKSTLLRVLTNLETPESGTISLNNKKIDLANINKNHLIGMIFQNFNLFEHMTVLHNITFVLEKVEKKSRKEAKKIALELLKLFGLIDKIDAYPTDLSGGQKQRLAIARSVTLKPKIICFDEPTSALDPLLTNFVAETIKELASQEIIILIATHDKTLLEKLPGTIHLMHEGKIIETAKTDTFLNQSNNYPHIKTFIQGHNQVI